MKIKPTHLSITSILTLLLTTGLHAQQPTQSRDRAALLLSILDKDEDRKISEYEAQGGLKQNFTIADRNGDRQIDLDELKKLLEMATTQRAGVGAVTPPVPIGPSFGTRNDELLSRMQSLPSDQDGEFLMVNLIKYREKAKYADRRETDLTGEEANALYAPVEFIAEIGGNVAYMGLVNHQMGNMSPSWDQVAIVRYPSRSKFLKMVSNPEFQRRAVHKDAGVEVTQVLLTERQAWTFSNPKRVTDEEDAFTLAQLLKYRVTAQYGVGSEVEEQRTGKEAMDAFDNATEEILCEVGATPVLKTRVKGAIFGDGRTWDEFRLLHFPSQAAYTEAVQNMQDVIKHRDAAIEDGYLMKAKMIRQQIKP